MCRLVTGQSVADKCRVFSGMGGDVRELVCTSVDHSILCKRMQLTFGLDGQVLAWFCSYLHGCSQYVGRGILKSPSVLLVCGVPQGSVLGPILFTLYTAELIGLTEQHGFCPQPPFVC